MTRKTAQLLAICSTCLGAGPVVHFGRANPRFTG